jgi:hypothetical protein
MLATNAGPNHDKTWRVFRSESSAAGSDEETGSEGGEAGAISRILDRCGVQRLRFQYSLHFRFLLTIVNAPSQSAAAAVVLPQEASRKRMLAVNE